MTLALLVYFVHRANAHQLSAALNLKFQKSTGQLEKTSEIKNTRIKIAKLKTKISKIYGENNA